MSSSNIDTSSQEFQNALNLIRYTNHSVFLTGKAGTGKSTFLRYVCDNTRKRHVILAPTGIAAINAGGVTLHSFFKLPFHPLTPEDPRYAGRRLRDFLRYNKEHIKLLQQLELIVIDEISMVRADIIDFVDRILRHYTGNMRQPFGGKQMLLIGDVFQLEPVVKGDERDILNRFYPAPYFFNAKVFQQMELVSIELTKVYRQRDAGFIRALDHIRMGQLSQLEMQLLNCRVGERQQVEISDAPSNLNIVLATRRDNVDYINQTNLDRIEGDATVFTGEIKGDFPESSLPTLMNLELKCGAQIIFIKNDPDHRWVNGTLGLITGISEEEGQLTVVTDAGKEVLVERDRWANVKYTYNETEKKIEEEELGVFKQFPVRLAWAITIHKSQGLTFDQVTIDFGGGTFAGGQAYVALSRCRTLEGMTLSRPISRNDVFVKPDIVQFARSFNDGQAINRALTQAKADIEYTECMRAFERGDMKECLDHFFVAIHSRYDIEQPAIRRLIQRKLGVIPRLRQRNRELQDQMQQQQNNMKKFAREYVQMGKECITQAHNARAALANYSKALELCPTMVDAWVLRGNTLTDIGEYDEALHHLNHAIELQSASFKAWFGRGRLYMQMGRYEEAVSDLDHASGLNPDNARVHVLMAECYGQLGQEELADLHISLAEQLKKKKKK